MLVTNRLQPIHRGHVLFWKSLVRYRARILVVCVLRNENRLPSAKLTAVENEFARAAKWTRLPENNPLPDFHRLRLAALAISSDPILRQYAFPMLRSRPDTMWESSLEDLPENRLWVFNATKSNFDRTKPDFYRARGERVKVVQLGDFGYEGSSIREQLKNGTKDLSFLPRGCTTFFRNHCLKFFQNSNRDYSL